MGPKAVVHEWAAGPVPLAVCTIAASPGAGNDATALSPPAGQFLYNKVHQLRTEGKEFDRRSAGFPGRICACKSLDGPRAGPIPGLGCRSSRRSSDGFASTRILSRLRSLRSRSGPRRWREPTVHVAFGLAHLQDAVPNDGTVVIPDAVAPSWGGVLRREHLVLRLQPDAPGEQSKRGTGEAYPESPGTAVALRKRCERHTLTSV